MEKSDSPTIFVRLAAVGPGIVYALQVQGSADIVSNAAAGASYGYSLIWALGLTLILRFVWVNTSAKYVLVTGESLLEGYARVGRWALYVVLVSAIFLKHFYNLYLILIMGSAVDQIFPLPTPWSSSVWSILFTLLGFTLMYRGGYPVIEGLCKWLITLMGASLVVAALLADPDPVGIARGVLIPTVPDSSGLYSVFFLLMALIGTEAGSMGNLTYAYYIREKGWKGVSWLKQQRFDLAFGVGSLFLMGALLQIASAGTIHPLGLQLEGTEDLIRIFSETQGLVGLIIFSLGLWGATFSTFVGSTVGFSLITADVCRLLEIMPEKNGEHEPPGGDVRRGRVYRTGILFWSFSPLYILFTGVQPVWLVLAVNSLVVVVVPVLALTLVKITNDRALMGPYKNGWFTNTVLLVLVLVSLYFTYQNGIDLFDRYLLPMFT